jgi:hypothetical protein
MGRSKNSDRTRISILEPERIYWKLRFTEVSYIGDLGRRVERERVRRFVGPAANSSLAAAWLEA